MVKHANPESARQALRAAQDCAQELQQALRLIRQAQQNYGSAVGYDDIYLLEAAAAEQALERMPDLLTKLDAYAGKLQRLSRKLSDPIGRG